jgi:hypothetical protein
VILGFNQKATYWGVTGDDIYGGKTYSAPSVRQVRWEDVTEQFINKAGEESVSAGKVFLEGLVDINGYLYLGELDPAVANPTTLDAAREIQAVKKIPDMSNLQQLTVVYL